jgi:hypothetical protein
LFDAGNNMIHIWYWLRLKHTVARLRAMAVDDGASDDASDDEAAAHNDGHTSR